MIDWLCEHWHDPDEGIWETRGGRRPFVYGQLMSWVAFDRAIRMASNRGRPADLGRWTPNATDVHDADHDQRLERRPRGVRPVRGTATCSTLSLVLMPLTGFIVPNDPRWQSTMTQWRRRSSPTASSTATTRARHRTACPDRKAPSRSARSCTSTRSHAQDDSTKPDSRSSKMLTYANHVGLYAEEIDCHRPADRQLPAGVHPPRPDRRGREPRPARWTIRRASRCSRWLTAVAEPSRRTGRRRAAEDSRSARARASSSAASPART